MDNSHPTFKVDLSELVAQSLLALQNQAIEEGRGDEVVRAFRKIIQRLKKSPRDFGEPLYRLPVLKMQVRCGVVRPIVVHFGVVEDRPLVFIKKAYLFPLDP